jgi:hypothetical protein
MAQIIDGPVSYADRITTVFDQYYNFSLDINADQYDIVYSYFYSLTKNKDTASNFTTMLFRISNITGQDIIQLLNSFKGQSELDATTLLAYYLNSTKSKTTLYGINLVPTPNKQVQRNVVV